MQKAKEFQYAAVGVQETPGVRFGVRSSVCVPDSEAGREDELGRRPFRAGKVASLPRKAATIPLSAAMIILCALFVIFGAMVLEKNARRAALAKDISAMVNTIAEVERENSLLTVEVAQARDQSVIGDRATQHLGMQRPDSVTPTWVTAPDTRPFEEKTTVRAEMSPNSLPEGIMSGSR